MTHLSSLRLVMTNDLRGDDNNVELINAHNDNCDHVVTLEYVYLLLNSV